MTRTSTRFLQAVFTKGVNCPCAFLVVMASTNFVFAQVARLDKNATVSQIEDYSVGPVERQLVRVANAMPEDKYAFAPTDGEFKGVRTFARHVKHVAVSNYVMAAATLQEKPPVALGGDDANGPASIVSKADSLSFLKDSFCVSSQGVPYSNDRARSSSPSAV